MTRKLFFTSVAVSALAAGSAFAQTQQPATESQQQPAAQQQEPAQQESAQQQPAAEQQAGQTEVQVIQPGQEQVAAGECALRMEEVAGGQFFVGAEAGYRRHTLALNSLRDAAVQLQADGLDEACLRVVEAMEIAIENYQTAGPPAEMAARGEVTREQLKERLVPLDASEMPINTARIEDSDVHNFDGEDIGNIEGFLMAQGRPTHIIVSHGGFWNIGGEDVAIPVDIVRWDPEWQAFFVPLSGDDLDQAPEYDERAWDTSVNDQFYDAFRG
jgi:hypothetical protein